MITKNQKEIISLLTTEFEKMNTKPSKGGSLFDVGSILSQHEADKKRVNEIKLNNESFEGMQLDILKEWTAKFNKDLVQLGLKAEHNSYKIRITALEGHVCYTKEITIYVELTNYSERVGNGSERIYNGIRYKFGKLKFETMEELIKRADGHGRITLESEIRRLYNDMNVV
jgi:hypothetical protein